MFALLLFAAVGSLGLGACGSSSSSVLPVGDTTAVLHWSWSYNGSETFTGTVAGLPLTGSVQIKPANSDACGYVNSGTISGSLGSHTFHLTFQQCPSNNGMATSDNTVLSGTIGGEEAQGTIQTQGLGDTSTQSTGNVTIQSRIGGENVAATFTVPQDNQSATTTTLSLDVSKKRA